MSIGLALAGLAAIGMATKSRRFRLYTGEDWLRDQGFTEILRAETRDGWMMTPVLDTPYHSAMDTIREACEKKRTGEYKRVWIEDRHGRREICR